MNCFMFDTVAFNRIVENDIDIELIKTNIREYYVTHIQRDEISQCDDPKRAKLLKVFNELSGQSIPTESLVIGTSRIGEAKIGGDKMVPTESLVYGVSRWGQSKWTSKDNLYEPIKAALDAKKKKKNNIQDALIAETSIKNGYILITDDEALREVVNKYHGGSMSFNEFILGLSSKKISDKQ